MIGGLCGRWSGGRLRGRGGNLFATFYLGGIWGWFVKGLKRGFWIWILSGLFFQGRIGRKKIRCIMMMVISVRIWAWWS